MELISMLFSFIRGVIFDHKDEYNFKSTKFNTKKVLILILFIISLISNILLLQSFIKLGNKYLTLQHEVKILKDKK